MQRHVYRIISLAFSLAILLLLRPPAKAQYIDRAGDHWRVTYKYDGNIRVFDDQWADQYCWLGNTDDPGHYSRQQGWISVSSDCIYAHVESAGTITATLTWVGTGGDPASAPPPNKLWIEETANSECSSMGASLAFGGTVDDGRGDATIFSENGWGVTYSSSGKHYVQVDSSSGTIIRTATMSSNMDFINLGNSGPEMYALCDFVVDPYPKAVIIQRMGARGETVDSDGTTHGDTTYGYFDWSIASGDGTPLHNISQSQFKAVFIGPWNQRWAHPFEDGFIGNIPDVTWQWNFAPHVDTPLFFEDQWDFAARNMPDGQIWIDPTGNWKGTPDALLQVTATYNATDNQDGITAIAHYILTVHDPYNEKTHHNEQLADPPFADPHGLWMPNYTGADQLMSGSVSNYTESAVTVTVGNVIPVSDWILNSMGIGIGFSVNFGNQTSSNAVPISVPNGYQTRVMLQKRYVHHWGTADVYDEAGYVGEEPFDFKVPDNPAWALLMDTPTPAPLNPNGGGH